MPDVKDSKLYDITKELMQVYQQIDHMTEDIEAYKKELESLNQIISDKDFQINELQLEIERREAKLNKYEKTN